MDSRQYFIGHKPFELPSGVDGIRLQVGSGPDFGDLRDNTGEQISEKNPSYCELTALYWIWKNQNPDAVGINHYRRWFQDLKNPKKIEEILNEYDIILPVFEPYRETVREQYCIDSGFEKDLDTIGQIIKETGPEFYPAFEKVMNQGGIHQYNMMITSKELFDDYCSWVFPILQQLEKTVDLSEYNSYQKRIYGFLSERLLNVWVLTRGLKVYEMKVVQPEVSLSEKIRLKIRQKKNRRLFRLRYGRECR